MTQEALKLALEFIENSECGTADLEARIKEALAQEQEPVAWQLWVGADTPLNAPMGWHFYSTYDSLKSAEVSARTINSYQQAPFAKVVPLYTAPPQRTWVGLTDEERQEIWWSCEQQTPTTFVKAIEARLKELNT
jgi:hypothetical protein